jgi:hypothetical protein
MEIMLYVGKRRTDPFFKKTFQPITINKNGEKYLFKWGFYEH